VGGLSDFLAGRKLQWSSDECTAVSQRISYRHLPKISSSQIGRNISGTILYVRDDLIRKISPGGIITSITAVPNYPTSFFPGGNYAGDGGPATDALLNIPKAWRLKRQAVYIADYGNYRIRKISPNGVITTIAGNGTSGHRGDGGPATDAQLNAPRGIAVDAAGNVYVADSDSVRMLRPIE
jgi:hypothetical protein